MRDLAVRDLGRMRYSDALQIQHQIASERKAGQGVDHLLFVEHPHVVTMGRNGHAENVLVPEAALSRLGIELHETDRGGDVTYHGPGQIVMYPIMDLRLWKRDVGAFVRAIEQVLMDTLADFGIESTRIPKCTGVWVGNAKVAAIGIHLSRWVSTHGVALNVTTDMNYFQYIVPCGIRKPVTSMAALGVNADAESVKDAMERHFARIFDFQEISNDRHRNAPDGREHRRGHVDQVAEEAWR
jgi:lipoyl(octanoyl) transferase